MLSLNKRKAYFQALGLGEYNDESIKKLQQKYFTRQKDIDGVYGNNTDVLLRHVYNVETYTKNFSPAEFKCGCGGKYCTGYPTYMKPAELKNLQTIRDHYNTPITITCGLRCKGYNASLRGSVSNSLHLKGQAIDFYMKGHTDTLTRRKNTINYIRKLANHNYAYGNGYCSVGYAVSAPNMGNAVHFDTKNNAVKGFATRVIFKAKQTASKKPTKTKTANEKFGEAVNAYWAKMVAAKLPYRKYHERDNGGENCIGGEGKALAYGGGISQIKKRYLRDSGSALGSDGHFNQPDKELNAMWKSHCGPDWKLITNGGSKGGSPIKRSMLDKYSPGTVVLICYDKNGKYKHVAHYAGKGYIYDFTSTKRGKGKNRRNGAFKRRYAALGVRATRAFVYTGKGKF